MEKSTNNCSHSSVYKEYIFGHSTGEYICNSCGETFLRSELPIKGKETNKTNEIEKLSYDHDRQRYYNPDDYGGFPSHW